MQRESDHKDEGIESLNRRVLSLPKGAFRGDKNREIIGTGRAKR